MGETVGLSAHPESPGVPHPKITEVILMNDPISISAPVIAGVKITTDEIGRFNLNALHQASHLGANKAPAQWLRTKAATALIGELEKQTVQKCIVSLEGRSGGTFAHELVAISYAGWISPAFQLQVNQVFSDFKTGKLPANMPNFNNPAEAARAWADEYEKNLVAQQKLEEADREVQRLQGVCHDIAAQFQPGMTIPAFCRQLNGVNIQQVQNNLVGLGMLRKHKRDYLVCSYYRDKWFTERQTEPVDGVQRVKVILTLKGAINLYKLYLKDKLPMKADWDGQHSHCLFDQPESKEVSAM